MNWTDAQTAWNKFLEQIDVKRRELHCSTSSAWFRGQENSDWHLVTSLFRCEHRVDADTKKRLAQSSKEILQAEKRLAQCQRTVSEATHDLGQARRSSAELQPQAQNTFRATVERCALWQKELKKGLALLNQRRQVLECTHYGEREAFVEFGFRAGHSEASSWEVLAEMQHYRALTRLLDWTEVLAIAVYFALKHYIPEVLKQSEHEPAEGETAEVTGDDILRFVEAKNLPTPRVWILNPYHLSRLARDENSLWDPTKDKRYDYYESFFLNLNWEFKLPVPIYIPWKNRRITAQRAMFTVQGLDKGPLDEQLGRENDVVRYVDMGPGAAVYAVKHLMNFLGLNAYALFQDLDSLGTEIKRHFIIPNTRRQ